MNLRPTVTPRLTRVGVVGTGIAGLAAAWFLRQRGCDVTVIERQASLGMDAYSIPDPLGGNSVGESSTHTEAKTRCDVPPRMFNSALWPNLFQLYRDAGVEFDPIEPSKTFCGTRGIEEGGNGSRDNKPWLKLGKSYLPQFSPTALLNSKTRSILAGIVRMMGSASNDLTNFDNVTFREYLQVKEYSDAFIYGFLYPSLSSTVCTCSYAALDRYPAAVLLGAMQKLVQPEGLNRTRHGTVDVVSRLAAGISQRLNCAVRRILPSVDGDTATEVAIELDSAERLSFDHLVIATQANMSARLLNEWLENSNAATTGEATHPSNARIASGIPQSVDRNRKIDVEIADRLGRFEYENVPVVVHSDERLLPARRSDWSTFNLLCSKRTNSHVTSSISEASISNSASYEPQSAAMCSIWLNRFYPSWQQLPDVFQTIMPVVEPASNKVIGVGKMQRPVVNLDTLVNVRRLAELQSQGQRRIWFCGSYMSEGVPLLESGVASAKRLVDLILDVAAV